jgi:hypothetical protein
MTLDWPKQGVCGACARPAELYPSGRWGHKGRACLPARWCGLWRAEDLPVKNLARFIPEGQPLPTLTGPLWITTKTDESGFPIELCWAGRLDTRTAEVRAWLADEAENGVRA